MPSKKIIYASFLIILSISLALLDYFSFSQSPTYTEVFNLKILLNYNPWFLVTGDKGIVISGYYRVYDYDLLVWGVEGFEVVYDFSRPIGYRVYNKCFMVLDLFVGFGNESMYAVFRIFYNFTSRDRYVSGVVGPFKVVHYGSFKSVSGGDYNYISKAYNGAGFLIGLDYLEPGYWNFSIRIVAEPRSKLLIETLNLWLRSSSFKYRLGNLVTVEGYWFTPDGPDSSVSIHIDFVLRIIPSEGWYVGRVFGSEEVYGDVDVYIYKVHHFYDLFGPPWSKLRSAVKTFYILVRIEWSDVINPFPGFIKFYPAVYQIGFWVYRIEDRLFYNFAANPKQIILNITTTA